jgi:hypothetical protein
VNGGWLSAAGAEEIVRSRRFIRRFRRPLNFPVRRQQSAAQQSPLEPNHQRLRSALCGVTFSST